MKKITESLLSTSTEFAAPRGSATECNYAALSEELIKFLKDRVRPIDAFEFRRKFGGELTPNQKMRLFNALVKKFSLRPTETNNFKKKYSENSQRYIFDMELRNSLTTRLTPERVEILCLSEKVFRKVGRKNPAEEAITQARINILLGNKVVADLTPMQEISAISPEEQEILDLKAKLESLQREVEQKQAALDKKNRLIKIGNEILEMFNITVEELKEITNLI